MFDQLKQDQSRSESDSKQKTETDLPFWYVFPYFVYSKPFQMKQKQKQVCTVHNWNCEHLWHLWPKCDQICFVKKTHKKTEIDWCCLYHFVRNSTVGLLEALCVWIFSFRFVNISFVSDFFFCVCVWVCARSLTKSFFRLSQPGSCAWLSPNKTQFQIFDSSRQWLSQMSQIGRTFGVTVFLFLFLNPIRNGLKRVRVAPRRLLSRGCVGMGWLNTTIGDEKVWTQWFPGSHIPVWAGTRVCSISL